MAEALGRLCHAASSKAKASRSGSPRGSTHSGSGTPHAASSTSKASRPGSAHGGARTGTHAADAVKVPHTASTPVSSNTGRHSSQDTASCIVMHSPGSDSQGSLGMAREQEPASVESRTQSASPVVNSDSHGGRQDAQVVLPFATAEDAAQPSAGFEVNQRSQQLLSDLHAAVGDTAAEGEQSQSSAEGEEAHGIAEDEETQGVANGVEGGAVGGAAGMLAALQQLDAQPAAAQLSADSQPVSSTRSGESTQEPSNTPRQSASASWGQSEDEQLSVRSSVQARDDATAVVTEFEEQTDSDMDEASGSLTAASAANPADPLLLIAQVGRPVLHVCILLPCPCPS